MEDIPSMEQISEYVRQLQAINMPYFETPNIESIFKLFHDDDVSFEPVPIKLPKMHCPR